MTKSKSIGVRIKNEIFIKSNEGRCPLGAKPQQVDRKIAPLFHPIPGGDHRV